jgi:fido (protein-threonine AMPylation protein)
VGLYRVEIRRLVNSEIYYLVKDVRVVDTTSKVRVKLGYTKPKNEEELITKPNKELELKAIEKHLGKSRYKARYLTPEMQCSVDETRFWVPLISMFYPSEYEAVETLHETEYIAGTTAIEGNTLSVSQVEDLIRRGVEPAGKSMKDQLEVLNAEKAGKYRKDFTGRVSISFILKLHEFMMDRIKGAQPGEFRKIDVWILGEDVSVTPAIQIEEELNEAIADYYVSVKAGGHPFEEAVLFHHRFELIHPFGDGNGRVGREVLRYMLAKAGYPDILIRGEDREKYLDALRAGGRGEKGLMVKVFVDLLVNDRRAKLFKEI